MADEFITLWLTEDDAVALGFSAEEIAMAKRGEKIRARRAPLPVKTEYPAPVMTVEEWAQSASSLLLAAEAAINCVDETSVETLKNATMDFVPTDEFEGKLLTACVNFCRQYRKHQMFGDAIADDLMALKEIVVVAKSLAPAVAPAYVDPYADEPYLYILMRNDLASMNAGKAVAQGTHAANQMVYEARKWIGDNREDATTREKSDVWAAFRDLLETWEQSANGFGTCICLSVNEEQMRAAVAGAQEAGLHAGITHDPSYPLKDGATLHLLPLDTCAYIFGKKAECKPFTGNFPLMP